MLWLTGFSLRVTVLALSPVMNQAAKGLGLSAGAIGGLTAIPSLCFAVAAIPGALLIRRIGTPAALLAGLLVNALGAFARGAISDLAGLATATAVMSLGIGLMQGAMPSLVRQWLSDRVGVATAVYTLGLLMGEIAPMVGPLPVAAAAGDGGWRAQLAAWSLPVAIAFAAVVLFGRRAAAGRPPPGRLWPDWSTPALWQTGLMIGAVNAAYFGLNGFLPVWLARAGLGDEIRAVLFTLNVAQLPAALLLIVAAERLVGRWWVYAVASLTLLCGALSFALAPGAAPHVAAAVAGFCLALLLGLALTVPPLVSAEDELPHVTAGAFTLGYGLAVVTALATGWLDERAPGVLGALPIAAASAAVAAVGRAIAGSLRSRRGFQEPGG